MTSDKVVKTYILLTLFSTFASSFIWGINTLFLLDAGLSITQAFIANAFFTVGQVIFEVPTGVVADAAGRRLSYLLGTATLVVSTLLYLYLWQIHGPFYMWAISSVLLGLGFTFFSGATEAWLVDALHFTRYKDTLESAFSKGQIAGGIAMLAGTLAGGLIAQFTNLGVPYILRIIVLLITFVIAFVMMRDIGFAPVKSVSVRSQIRIIAKNSVRFGLANPPVRWLMLAAPFASGVGFYGFYAMQPYLLQLYGDPNSYAIAGLAATLLAGTQIVGGVIAPKVAQRFTFRTTAIAVTVIGSSAALIGIGLIGTIWAALVLFAIWGTLFALTIPIRQSYMNKLIPSEQRATVLSFDNLLASTGGVVIQPGLGKAADAWSYGTSYVIAGLVNLVALPFIILARREKTPADKIK